jgi:shikimate dehydrogenase
MKHYGIIGYPLTHSFSQEYFTEKFHEMGLADCSYGSYPIHSISELEGIIKSDPNLKGLNVTIPYKQEVLPFLSDRSHIPQSLKACNCIKIEDQQLIGHNTDVTGFERSLLPLLKKQHTNALVLGDGGAAAAVKFVLDKLGIKYRSVSRTAHGDLGLTYADIDENIIRQNSLLINTTPLGTFPDIDECPAIPYELLNDQHLLYDLVYNPAKTLFLRRGEERGAAIKNGYEMLLIQAEESWKIWNEL